MSTSARTFFTTEQIEDIRQAILVAELDTSGEIRVHIENTCPGNVLDRATDVFSKLKMQQTQLRNGVLIYLAVKNRKFAIIGDSGINAVVEKDYWDRLKMNMLEFFREGKFADGLIKAIHDVGTRLKSNFPFQRDDINELPDDVSFEDE